MNRNVNWLGRFASSHALAIAFICLAFCIAGIYSAFTIPSSVFPRTDFPRVVVLVDNGVTPADDMMATVTRPIEEAVKDIPGVRTIRSATGRGAAEINIFFDWQTNMIQAEQYVLGRLAQVRSTLPLNAVSSVFRLTFSSFPILGVSLTAVDRELTELWETARYDVKPRLLRIPGVARVNLVGGRAPEFHVVVDALKLQATNLSLIQVTDALNRNNIIVPTGMHEENHLLYLAVVDNRVHVTQDIEEIIVQNKNGRSVKIREFAKVLRAPEPVFNRVTADGVDAVLLNIYSQPDGDTLAIAEALDQEMGQLKQELNKNLKLAVFYDQSRLVKDAVGSVWEAIGFGLLLSVAIIYGFLKSWRTTLTAAAVIPITVLTTLVVMKWTGLTFNLMTLGGITAAIGLIIDDAIVVVEAIHSKLASGQDRITAIAEGIGEIVHPLIGSTLTPVVVFLPLSQLEGIPGVFFRALALSMTVSLLTSLLLALTLTPSLAAWVMAKDSSIHKSEKGLFLQVKNVYEMTVRAALRFPGRTLIACFAIVFSGIVIFLHLDSDFLPAMDEGGFVIDYHSPWGTSLSENNRLLLQAEAILRATPEVESYSRRTGARLALAIAQPNTGDFLVKLKNERTRKTEEVISELRSRFNAAVPALEWEFPGILSDLIGDLAWSPKPVEIKLYSTDTEFLKRKATEIEAKIKQIPGIVDTFDGLVMTGPTLRFKVHQAEAQRLGFSTQDIGTMLNIVMLGQKASNVLEGDRVVNIRVRLDDAIIQQTSDFLNLPLRATDGTALKLSQLTDLTEEPSQLELHREDLRQNVAVTARLEGRDLGSAIAEIKQVIANDASIPPGSLEFGGLFKQQQESFRNLLTVLFLAIFLVFTVLLLEFKTFKAPVAILCGALLALFGTVAALALTGNSLNIVSFLGAIIGIGIVAKNGILMLDCVEQFQNEGLDLTESLVRSGMRRLRPVLMTSMAAALGLLPLSLSLGSGADMLRPLAIAVIGALAIAVLLSLIATPVFYATFSNSNKATKLSQ